METYGFESHRTPRTGERFALLEGGGAPALSGWGAAAIGGGMFLGMGMQGLFGYLGSQTQAGAMTSIASTNANALIQTTQTQANAAVDQTRLQVMGMVFAANTQYLQAIQQLQYMDIADRRQGLMWRQQLSADIRVSTLQYNAQIHANNLSHQERMSEISTTHQERMAELDQPEERTRSLDDYLD